MPGLASAREGKPQIRGALGRGREALHQREGQRVRDPASLRPKHRLVLARSPCFHPGMTLSHDVGVVINRDLDQQAPDLVSLY